MRRSLQFAALLASTAGLISAAERKSWSKIYYVGGTISVKASPYEFNTTLSVSLNPDVITISVAPAKAFSPIQNVKLKASAIQSLSAGPSAYRHIAALPFVQLPAKTPPLFGLLENHSYLGITYEEENGKPGAVLLDSLYGYRILSVLKTITGKDIDGW